MRLTDDILDRILTGDIKELWKMFLTLYYDPDYKLYEEYMLVRYGQEKGIMFDINYYFQHTEEPSNKYLIDVNYKTRKVQIGNRKYKLEDFWTEIERREALLRRVLIESTQEDDPLSNT